MSAATETEQPEKTHAQRDAEADELMLQQGKIVMGPRHQTEAERVQETYVSELASVNWRCVPPHVVAELRYLLRLRCDRYLATVEHPARCFCGAHQR